MVLGIGPAAVDGLKLTMREHLEAIHDIVAVLGQQDFELAAKLAHEELSFPKHYLVMQREPGTTFPSKYHEPAMAHHQVHANQTTLYGLALVHDITEVWP